MPNTIQSRTPKLTQRMMRVTAALALSPLTAAAQPSAADPLETLTVVGTRLAADEASFSAVTVLDRIAITARHKSNVADLLAGVRGVHTSLPGGRGSVGELFMRGGEPNFTAVLIDGIFVNDPTNTRGGTFDFATLDPREIERIEIFRGPASSVYGSDALSGVINIVTPSGTVEPSATAVLAAGDEDFGRIALRLGGPVGGDSRYSVRATKVRDGRRDSPSGYRSETLSVKLDLLASKPADLTLIARSSASSLHAYPDSSGGPALAILRAQDQREARGDTAGLNWNRPVGSLSTLHVTASIFDHEERMSSPGVAAGVRDAIPPSISETDFSRRGVNVFLDSVIRDGLRTAVGASFTAERGISDGAVMFSPEFSAPTSYELTRDTVAAFAEVSYAAPADLHVSASVRGDHSESRATELTGTLAVTRELTRERARVRLAWGTGFKLPSLFSLGHPLVGNPALEPETVSSWELGFGVGQRGGKFTTDINLFSQHFENLIDFDLDSFQSVNRDRVRTDGIEISADYSPGDNLTVSEFAAWLDVDVIGSDQGLRQRPEQTGGIRLGWSISTAVTLQADWRYVGKRLDSSVLTGDLTLPSYTRADLSLAWQVNPRTALQIAVDNAFDQDYAEAIGFPNLGRRLRAAYTVEFGAAAR
jgi:outer membrane cobalamin receptor